MLDWGKLRDVEDPATGKKKTLWMFSGILGYSRYLMVRLVWTMDLATTLTALEGFLRHMGGVPGRMTTDNPKCFSLTASPYEPLLNPGLERFAAHYGLTVECLPPRDPQKKGKIERVVPFLRRLYEAHGDRWEGLEESQTYLDGKLAIANQRQHGTTRKRPLDLLAEERRVMRALSARTVTCGSTTNTIPSTTSIAESRSSFWGARARCPSTTPVDFWKFTTDSRIP